MKSCHNLRMKSCYNLRMKSCYNLGKDLSVQAAYSAMPLGAPRGGSEEVKQTLKLGDN